jgi:protein-S-isoprenylcysteine O-methyltransferase Ste14
MSDSDDRRDYHDRLWPRLLKGWAVIIGAAWLFGPVLAAGPSRWVTWPGIWIYGLTIASGAAVQRVYVRRHNPAILVRRRSVGAGTKRWDIGWVVLAGPISILPPIVAGLGVRFGWPTMPVPCAALGVLLNTAGGVVWAHAMATNAHFEPTVRIQRDVGHAVVDKGPYRTVRHPGYAGFCLGVLGTPFLLLSWATLAVAPLLVVWFIVRAALEDATLRRELAGYAEYAKRVRFRLVPGIW